VQYRLGATTQPITVCTMFLSAGSAKRESEIPPLIVFPQRESIFQTVTFSFSAMLNFGLTFRQHTQEEEKLTHVYAYTHLFIYSTL
jgi:hypothetical protein